MIFTADDKRRSHRPINTDKTAKDTITTIVEPMSSSLVDHDTLPISSLTSLKKPTNLFPMAIFTYRFLCLTPYLYILIGVSIWYQGGRSGRNRTPSHGFGDRWFTVNRRSSKPWDSRPTAGLFCPYFISLCGVCFLQNLQNLLRCSLSGFCFLFLVE